MGVAPVTVTLTPVVPNNLPGLTFALRGDATYAPATGGTGGWQIVDRPRLVAATQWYDRSPMQLTLPLLIDSTVIYGTPNQSVEQQCMTVDSWQQRAVGADMPPIFSISGPVAGIQRLWCLYQLSMDKAIRDPDAGFRVQQSVDLTMYEYNSPWQGVLGTPSPAEQYVIGLTSNDLGAQSFLLYTVVAGDTLSSIAAAWLGNWEDWTEIATLNNIRDPLNILPGQALKLPYN